VDIPTNHFKRALSEGKVLYGLWNTLSGSYAVEAVAGAGFDWLMIDTEHSPNDLETVLTHLQILAAYPTEPVVRVPWNDMVTIKRYLDIGAQTLLIPQVNTPEEAKAAVSYTRYPPTGLRGVGGTTRATRFGRVKNYAQHAHEEICVLVQVESQRALDNIEAIAAVDGVDGVFVGPADLHASLGYAGETRNAAVTPSINDAFARIRKAGRAAGTILTGDAQDVQGWIERGVQFVAVGSDLGLLARGADALCAKFKPGHLPR
jgi:4-hydroxy-2-oxoheptanedioate aldolase